MANCPDDNDMACYIDGLLSDDEIRQIEKHLLDCDSRWRRRMVAYNKKDVRETESYE